MTRQHRFALKLVETSFDEAGDPAKSETTIFEGWATMANVGSRQYWEAAALGMEDTVRLTTRWDERMRGLDPKKLRIECEGRSYRVKSIQDVLFEGVTAEIKAVMSS